MGLLLQELFHRKLKNQKSIAVLCDPDTSDAWNNGADVVVLGNGIFEDPTLLQNICEQALSTTQNLSHFK